MSRSVRSLAAEAGLPVRECRRRLQRLGLEAAVGGQRLDGPELAAAREALGLERPRAAGPSAPRPALSEAELMIRLLRPLREKGKVGRERTTPIEHVWGHGVPDHLKAEAKRRVEALLAEGCLAEKVSQGRRHVWLTGEGLARLRAAEAARADGAGRAPSRP